MLSHTLLFNLLAYFSFARGTEEQPEEQLSFISFPFRFCANPDELNPFDRKEDCKTSNFKWSKDTNISPYKAYVNFCNENIYVGNDNFFARQFILDQLRNYFKEVGVDFFHSHPSELLPTMKFNIGVDVDGDVTREPSSSITDTLFNDENNNGSVDIKNLLQTVLAMSSSEVDNLLKALIYVIPSTGNFKTYPCDNELSCARKAFQRILTRLILFCGH